MGWRARGVLFAVLAVVLTLFPPIHIHQASACPPDRGSAPSIAYAAAPRPPITPPAFVADLASKNPRTFGRHVGHAYLGDPVDVVSGAYSFSTGSELRVPGHGLDFAFSRTYNSADDFQPSPLGPGWVHSYDWEYYEDSGQARGAGTLRRGDGRRGVQPDDVSWTYSAADNTFSLVTHDHTSYIFGSSYYRGANCIDSTDVFTWVLTTIKSAAGDQMNLTWSALVWVGTGPFISGGMAKVLLAVTDTQGRGYSFGYDARYDLASLTDPFGRVLSFTHNTSDQLLSATDLAGRTTTYTYDGLTRHITTVTDPNGWIRPTNVYAANGSVLRQSDGEGNVTTFAVTPYVSATVTDPRGTTTTYSEDSCGILQQQNVIGATTYTKTRTYNPACDLTSVTDALGNRTDFTYDTSHNLLSRTDPTVASGRPVTTYRYDGQKSMTHVADARGFTTDRTFDPTTQALLSERRQVDATTYATTSLTYGDTTNRLRPTAVTTPRGSLTSMAYDASGNLIRITDADANATTYGYDSFGRRTTVTDAEAHVTTITYDAAGQRTSVTNPVGGVNRFMYDGVGNLTSVTDRVGNATSLGYNRDSLLVSVQQHPDLTTTYTTTYTRDGNGNIIHLAQANGNTRDFTYDAFDQPTAVTEYTSQGSLTTTYGRDALGNMASRATPDGVTVNYAYDGLSRVTAMTAPGTSVTYSYDLGSDLTAMTDATGTTTYSYDGVRRPIAINAPGNSVTYSFDLDGDRIRVGYPLGDVAYGFTAAGRLATVTDWAGRVTRYAYRPSGLVSSMTYPNGMAANFSYDAATRLTQVTNTIGATTLTSHAYTLDAQGNRTSVAEFLSGITPIGTTDTLNYTFDGLNRLRTSTGAVSETFAYDGASNITSRTGPTATYTYDAADRVQSDGTRAFGWSAADRETSRGSDSFGYDALDRLTSATIAGSAATYAYAGDGLLASRNGVAYLWDRSRGPARLLQAGSDAIVYGVGPLYLVHGDGSTTTLALDGLGSARAEVSSSGSVTGSQRYAAYGAILQSSGIRTSPLGFAGELVDGNGLVYIRARWLDPSTGRFVTRDPLGGQPFGYGAGNPLSLVDPTGLSASPSNLDEGGGCADVSTCIQTTPAPEETPPVVSDPVSVSAPVTLKDPVPSTCCQPGVDLVPGPFGPMILANGEGPALPFPGFPWDAPKGTPPGPEFEWKGSPGSVPGDRRGSWTDGKQSIFPDLDSEKHGPHVDWKDPSRKDWRVYPDGRIEKK